MPDGLITTIAGLIAFAGAAFIARALQPSVLKKRICTLLVAEGLMVLTSFRGPVVWLQEQFSYETLLAVVGLAHPIVDCVLIAVYLPAMASMVESPLLRPFRYGWGSRLTLIIGCTLIGLILFSPFSYVWELRPDGSLYAGPIVLAIYVLLPIGYTYGLLAVLLAWRSAESPLARRRMGLLAGALLVRDVFWGALYFFGLTYELTDGALDYAGPMAMDLASAALIVYAILMVYGVLVVQIFDIDLRVKWTLKQGTVAAILVATFFVVSEAAAAFLTEQIGTVVGLLAAGVLVFFLVPLQSIATKLSDAAMPHVRDTEEFREYRKLQIYGEAFAEAVADGTVSPVQRAALNGLRDQLELDSAQTSKLESDLST